VSRTAEILRQKIYEENHKKFNPKRKNMKKLISAILLLALLLIAYCIYSQNYQTFTVYPSRTYACEDFAIYPISDTVYISTTAGDFKILKGDVYRQEGSLQFAIKGNCMILAYKNWKIKTAHIIQEHCPDVYVAF
jgi:hypothetical protein